MEKHEPCASAVLQPLVEKARLNDPRGDIPHHFELDGTVKTVYVTAQQRLQLLAGAIAIVILSGRFHLLPAAVATRVAKLNPAIPVLRNSGRPSDDGVPDNLVW